MFKLEYHQAISKFLNKEEIYGKRTMEAGSLVINKISPRFIVAPYEPEVYIGLDLVDGPGVDQVISVEDFLQEHGEAGFDLIFMSAVLETAKDYAGTISAIKRLCKSNGIIILTARTNNHPLADPVNECWRYEIEDIQTLFSDCRIEMMAEDAKHTEVFFKIVKPQNFVEIDYGKIQLYSPILQKRTIYNKEVLAALTSKMVSKGSNAVNLNKTDGYFSRYAELENLGMKQATDKSSLVHNYLNKYDMFLRHFRKETFNFLELGVFEGASVKMWSEYFDKAKIFGVDINPNCRAYATEKINILTADLSNRKSLKILTSINPTVIIDDASHIWSHQLSALFELFPSLPRGGVYIMEDLGTSLDLQAYPGYNDIEVNPYDILADIAEICTGGQVKQYGQFQIEIEELAKAVEMVTFFRESCILIKK